MDNWIFDYIIQWMFGHSAEAMSLLSLVIYGCILLLSLRLFGKYGLILFIITAFLASNIQVLHRAEFSFLTHPVALGTILFSLTYLASDMLTEHYGARIAIQSIGLSIFAQIAFALMMMTTLFHPPLGQNPENDQVYNALKTLFLPTPRLLVASLISYGLSQILDIWVFQKIKNLTYSRFIWLRSGVSTLLSGLADNIIFSLLAWIILSPHPVDLYTLIWTYILGTYAGRAIVSFISIPLMYLSYRVLPKAD